MRDYRLKFTPFEFESVLAVSGTRKANEHAVFRFSGVIDAGREQEYLGLALQEAAGTVTVVDESGQEADLITGIVTDLTFAIQNSLKVMTAELTTATLRMDLAPHTRTFQSQKDYTGIFQNITGRYEDGDFLLRAESDQSPDGLIAQYKETDWEFCRRLASHFNLPLYPATSVGGVRFYVGLPAVKRDITVKPSAWQKKSDWKEQRRKLERGLTGMGGDDAVCYALKEREVFDLGDRAVIDGREYFVTEIHTKLETAELYHEYILRTRGGSGLPKEYNEKIVGASLKAAVAEVKDDIVRLAVEEAENIGERQWFPYATPYSSPDGTGWYCMPEPGDSVRLYFPTEDEIGAYAQSSVHMETADRTAPERKSLKNRQGKEISLTPTAIVMSNNAGMSVEIDDNYGVRVFSDKNIAIEASGQVNIASATSNVNISAGQGIQMKQGDSSLSLDDTASFVGSSLHLQG
jgi:hypothetical protein